MSDLPTRESLEGGAWMTSGAYQIAWAYVDQRLLTREEAANAIIAFYNKYAGDVGQRWPTTEDALAWLERNHE